MGAARPAADVEALFRGHDLWLGGDGAGSVALPDGRVLWLFGDSFVAPAAGAGRRESALVNNTVGVSSSDGAMDLRWRRDGDRPAAYFTDPDPEIWIWPGQAVVVGDGLVVFLMRVRRAEPGRIPALTNFAVAGWTAVRVADPSGDPLGWTLEPLEVPPTPHAVLVGSGGAFVDGGHLYAHAVPPRRGVRRGHHLVRWPAGEAASGDLSRPEWWYGSTGGWRPPSAARPPHVAVPALTEFTVHRDPVSGLLARVELVGRRRPSLRVRWAERPEGPWSRPRVLHRPAEALGDVVFCYAAKAHPHLSGPGLVVTYNSNARDLEELYARDELYRPHALRVDLS